ncbi:MAG: hypothetical protein K0Q65_1529 [Clostridia bacterium]|jgi:hypothetical protein|nr:hypothetical protein [Clostridia bacterium]
MAQVLGWKEASEYSGTVLAIYRKDECLLLAGKIADNVEAYEEKAKRIMSPISENIGDNKDESI